MMNIVTNRASRRVPLLWMAVVLVATMVMLSAVRPGAAESAASPYVTSYTVPYANSEPTHIISLGADEVWFTLQNDSAIGRLVVAGNGQPTFTRFPTPTANSAPYDLASSGQYIWFTERQGNRIGRLTPGTGAISETVIPTADSQPTGITVTPDGNVWFVQRAANKIARYNPGGGTFDEFTYPTAGAQFEDVAAGRNDSIWATAPGLNQVIQLFPDNAPSQQFEIVPVLDFGLQPWPPAQIAVDDEKPWITAPSKDLVGRYAPGTLSYWRWYELFHEGTGARGLFLQRMGEYYYTWFTEPDGGRAGLLITHRSRATILTLFEQPLPGSSPRPMSITADPNGTAWITAPGVNAIMAWRQPYFYQGYLPATVGH